MMPNSTEIHGTDRDLEELLDAMAAGQKDPKLLARARARADEVCREMAAKYGHRKIAAQLVREARDDE